MAELRIGTEYEVGDVQNLALLMVDPQGHGLNPHDHWQKNRLFLTRWLHLTSLLQIQTRRFAGHLGGPRPNA